MMECAILDSDIVARKNGKRLPCEVLEDENARLRQELAIREASEQEKVIEYLGKECVDWEDKYLALAGENAKLRQQLADVTESIGRMEERCAKLRKLCADMHECLEDECKRCHEWGDGCDLEYEMRKLGVMG